MVMDSMVLAFANRIAKMKHIRSYTYKLVHSLTQLSLNGGLSVKLTLFCRANERSGKSVSLKKKKKINRIAREGKKNVAVTT